MTPMVLGLAAVSLLLIATGMLLWQRARLRSRQDVTAAFVDTQIKGMEFPRSVADGNEQVARPGRPQDTPWRYFFLRCGVDVSVNLCLKLMVPGFVLAVLALLFGGVLSAIGTLLLYGLLVYFSFWLKASRRQRKMVRQLPSFLDTLMRLMTIGNSLGSAYQTAVPDTEAPLRGVLERANRLVQAGLELEHALHQEARIFRLVELELVASVVGVAARFGGRADMVLERMAAFMRDLEQAQQELVALSAETRLSAWVIGLLPVGLGIFLIIVNNDMFMNMWRDPVGKNMLIGAGVLELIGAFWLFRLAKAV